IAISLLVNHDGMDCPDKDGWGVAYYEGNDVHMIKDSASAIDSPWVTFTERLSLRSTIVVAHVRHASTGEVALHNTHPFMRELGGQSHVFAHNGAVPNVINSDLFRLRRFHPLGTTDSEWAFCSLMDQMGDLWDQKGCVPPLDERTDVVVDFARRLKLEGPANFLYADGDALFLYGDRRKPHPDAPAEAPGLHVLLRGDARNGPSSDSMADEEEISPILLAASVPLTDDHWTPLSKGEFLVVRNGAILHRTQI
ncbi:MAG: class II glutamine amidotransferase, partial [Pigmentiphaga sp.]